MPRLFYELLQPRQQSPPRARRFFDFGAFDEALSATSLFRAPRPFQESEPSIEAFAPTEAEVIAPSSPTIQPTAAPSPEPTPPLPMPFEPPGVDRAMLLLHAERLIDHVDIEQESSNFDAAGDPDKLARRVISSPLSSLKFRDVEAVTKARVSEERELICRFIDACDDRCLDDDLKPPSEFFCPVSLRALREPVAAADNIIYEAAFIERHLFMRGPLSPLTRKPLVSPHLYSIHPIRALMAEWAAKTAKVIFPSGRLTLGDGEVLEIGAFLVEKGYVR